MNSCHHHCHHYHIVCDSKSNYSKFIITFEAQTKKEYFFCFFFFARKETEHIFLYSESLRQLKCTHTHVFWVTGIDVEKKRYCHNIQRSLKMCFRLDHLAQYWKLFFDRFFAFIFEFEYFSLFFLLATGHLVNSIFTSLAIFIPLNSLFVLEANKHSKKTVHKIIISFHFLFLFGFRAYLDGPINWITLKRIR